MSTPDPSLSNWKVCAGDPRWVSVPGIVKPINFGSVPRARLGAAAPKLRAALLDLLHNSAPPYSGDDQALNADFERRYHAAALAGLAAIAEATTPPTAITGAPISALDLDKQTVTCLHGHGITNIRDLTAMRELDVLKLPRIGRLQLAQITAALDRVGLSFKAD